MRRLRLLLAAAVLAFLAIVGFAPHAMAQEEGDHGSEATTTEEPGEQVTGSGEEPSHAAELCIELLEKGGAEPEDCADAPNQLLPETNEIIWGALGFFVVFFFVWKMGLPAIKKSMDARTERIRNDLDAAETQRTEADRILADYRAQLADAKNESARIIEEARQSADALRRDQESRLQAELAEMRSRAAADVDAAKTQAIADLRGEVAQLAIGAAEVVVKANLDAASQTQLVEDFINSVGSR